MGTSSDGITALQGRIEIAFAEADPNRVYLSANGDASGTAANNGRGIAADLYLSDNAGDAWSLVQNADGNDPDFLGGQGNYDYSIVVSPYYKN